MATKPAPRKRTASTTAAPAEPDIAVRDDAEGAADADGLPDEDAIAAIMGEVLAFARNPALARVRGYLNRLSQRPPQVLLMEGGTREERLAAVHYWMLLLNCPCPSLLAEMGGDSATGEGNALPLGWQSMPVAVQMVTHLHRDCFFMDGSAGSIKIDHLRTVVKPALGEPPREALYRMVVFHEAQAFTLPSANIMLKALEEPLASTSFVLMAPQRESLLPTLVSRSMIITLPWPRALPPESVPEEFPLEEGDLHGGLRQDGPGKFAPVSDAALEADVCSFVVRGTGMFQRTSQRSSVKSGVKGFDAAEGQALVTLCRRALVAAHTVRPLPRDSLAGFFGTLPPARLRIVDEVLAEAQESLNTGITPGVVADWVLTRLYLIFPRT